MHENVTLLVNIAVALLFALVGGILSRRMKMPTIVGYMLAGIIIGPFTPGFVGDSNTISQLSELGVIFLMFGVGLEFSFDDLLHVKNTAIPGALLQTLFATLLGFAVTRFWDWTTGAGIMLGLCISVASTVVLLRNLSENNLVHTSHGQVTIGWLIMEDIISVLLLVVLPIVYGGNGGVNLNSLFITIIKALSFVLIMLFIGKKLLPWLLGNIALTGSRELFILASIGIALGTALSAAYFFDISLALGAFVAGAIISQTDMSHQVASDTYSFKEAFSVLFFVSVGMMVNPSFILHNLEHLLVLILVIIIGKGLGTLTLGLVVQGSAKTFLVVAIGLAQVGEFSFILGSAGVSMGILTSDQYSLVLAASLITITTNPWLFKLLPKIEHIVQKTPLWQRLDHNQAAAPQILEPMSGHVVITGSRAVSDYLIPTLTNLQIPFLVIDNDVEEISCLVKENVCCLYGESSSLEILSNANLDRARMMIVMEDSDLYVHMVTCAVRKLAPELPIIARASTFESMKTLSDDGVKYIICPEMEAGLEFLRYSLLMLDYPLRDVYRYVQQIRKDNYYGSTDMAEEHLVMQDLLNSQKNIDIEWMKVAEISPINGKSLRESMMREKTGASVVAVMRNDKVTANPKSAIVFETGDRVGLIGDVEQIEAARGLF